MPDRDVVVDAQVQRALSDRAHGWWVADVLDAFSYLETDFGYRLAEVILHFRGSSLRYIGSTFELVIEYDPEDTGSVHADFLVHADLTQRVEHPRAFSVNDLLRLRDPALLLPDPRRHNLDKDAVHDAVETWAVGLREFAPDVLRGDWPKGISGHYLW